MNYFYFSVSMYLYATRAWTGGWIVYPVRLAWDGHAYGPDTIPVTLDDLDIDSLHAVIVSYCSSWFDLFSWLCGLIYFWFEGLNYYPNYPQMCGFITVAVFTFENLSQSCALRCALFILPGCFFSGACTDKKVLWIHFKGKRVSWWWSLISRLGFDVQIGALFLSVSYFLWQFSGSISFLRAQQTLSQMLSSHLQDNYVGPRCAFSPHLGLILHSK